MPSALNAFFKSGGGGSRRPSSSSSSVDTAPGPSSARTLQDRPTGTAAPAPSRLAASAQRSVPPIETKPSALGSAPSSPPPDEREKATRSESFPSIEIVSPTGSQPRHLWGPEDQPEEGGNQSPASLGQVSTLANGSQQRVSPSDNSSISDQKTPVAEDFRPTWRESHPSDQGSSSKMAGTAGQTDDEDDDPLYSLAKPVARKPTRSSGTGGKGRAGKGEAPDRHDIMRRAMAEATTSDTYGIGATSEQQPLRQDVGSSKANMTGSTDGSSRMSPEKSVDQSGHTPSSSQGTTIDHERPSEGSLSINHFAGGGADETVVLSDAAIMAAKERERMSKSGNDDRRSLKLTRPKLGSRANSFTSDTSASNDHAISSKDFAGGSTQMTPSKAKTFSHARSATTGMTPDTKPAKQSSLAVPSPSASSFATPDGRHRMHESSSTSSLLSSPLHRLRKNSDSGKKGGSPAGGIAGALAASGLAGMGVGHSDLLRQSQQAVSAGPSPRTSPTRSRPGSTYREFVGASQGGVYRDPTTGKMVEHGPSAAAHDAQLNMLRSRSGTGASIASHESSDASAGSGLTAAADFARGLQQQSPLIDATAVMSPGLLGNGAAPGMAADRARQLTPNGIGAVHGLSPSGLGERVELGLDDEPWPGADVDAQITGFAVASSKRNADFHALFNTVPDDDYLIEDYGCALVREILIQGRLYVSENHVCFHANIFGWITSIVTPFSDIVAIEKRMTAYVIPNAIQVATLHSKHTFASFLSRDTTYDVIVNIWKLSHPTLPSADSQIDIASDDESADGAEHDNETAKSRLESTHDDTPAPPSKKSKRNIIKKKLGIKDGANGTHGIAAAVMAPDLAAAIARGKSPAPAGGKKQAHRKTSCPCDKDKKHFSTVALDTTFPTIPEKLYNLIFTSGFMKEFWTENQKLMELQMSDWAPNPANNNMLSREISYIKPLSGGFGPKQTKCILTDENEHVDFDEYITTMTTTRTPEVPSGGSFSVKTRTCITWDGGNVSRILVTCMVEWTGRSMVKGIIDRASIDGQKQYYKELDGAIRSYIKEHASEFREEGEDPEETAAALEESAPSTKEEAGKPESSTSEEKQGLAKYVGMASEAGSAVFDMVSGGLDALSDLLGGVRPQVIVLGFIVFLLVISNLFALRGGSGRDPLDPHRLSAPAQHHRTADAMRYAREHGHDAASHVSASAEAVALAVRDVLKEYFEPHGHMGAHGHSADALHHRLHSDDKITGDPIGEISKLLGILDDVETRVAALRVSLNEAKASASSRVSS